MPPLPHFVPPMLAKLGNPFSSDDWLFEIKWDGTRAIALIEDGDYRLLNRKQNSAKAKYPEAEGLVALPSGTVLDGELVVFTDGKPDFTGMLRREQARGARRIQALVAGEPARYVVFDLLFRDFESIVDWPLADRRAALRELLAGLDDPRIVFSDGITGDGETFYVNACAQELEGVVAKRLTSRYLPGKRTDSWLKIKRRQRVLCAILGYMADEAGGLRSLVVGIEQEGRLVYAGRVGTGFSEAQRANLGQTLGARRRGQPLIAIPVTMDAVWVEPGLYCEVSFLEKTVNGELRAASFEGLVTDSP